MARELLLGGRSVRVADDRTYRCGLGDIAHVAVRVAQLAIGGISMSGAPAAAAQALFLSPRAGSERRNIAGGLVFPVQSY